jgi:hypothetical protein
MLFTQVSPESAILCDRSTEVKCLSYAYQVVGLGWNIFLSIANNRTSQTEAMRMRAKSLAVDQIGI